MWIEAINHIQHLLPSFADSVSQVNQEAGGALTYVSGGLNITFVGLFLTEQIYPKGIVRRQQAEIDEMRTIFVKEVTPALIKVTEVLAELPDSEAEVIRQLRRASSNIQNLTRRLEERGD